MPSVERNSLVGQKFGRLTVVSRVSNSKSGHIRFLCKCECGIEKICQKQNLQVGATTSCGCLQRERSSQHNKGKKHKLTHGLSGNNFYHIWENIIQRITNPNHKEYENYGGRGIKLHPKWEGGAESFVKYIRMALGPKPTPKHSLDRIDNEKGYIPGNLRWATATQQHHNRRPRNQWKSA